MVDAPPAPEQISRMTLTDFPQLRRLPARQRLSLAEALWGSAASDSLPVPVSHQRLICSRRASYERGEVAMLTMAELRKSIRRGK
jgi:putative addiction module component (TIGR02574 family)